MYVPNLCAGEGQFADPAHFRTIVATAKAIRTPVEQSDERLLAASHAAIRQQESAQQRELARGADDPGRSGPVMQMYDVPSPEPAQTDAKAASMKRSEERRVGKECVSTCRARWSPYN